MNEIALPSYVLSAINRLEGNGFSAYAVGGCVRDSILGRNVNDYDVCTSALPEETIDVFRDCHVIETGLKHGTVTVRIEHQPIEITTFRTEGDYSDGRHPDTVDFTSDIICDLSRRDFTVNAMAYSPTRGFVDPFNGLKDIKRNIIRTVGDPKKRFNEDALRILRALRFASVLNATIDQETSEAITTLRSRLSLISRERIREELLKLLCGEGMEGIMMSYSSVICEVIPELANAVNYDQNNPHHDHDLYKHLVLTASNLPKDPILRLAGLIHDIGKPACRSNDEYGISHFYGHAQISAEESRSIARSLKCSKPEVLRISSVIKFHDGVIEENEKAVRRRLNQLGPDGVFDLLDLQRADNLAQKNELPTDRLRHNEVLRKIAHDLIVSKACVSTKTLAINGNDLLARGYKGKQIGKALSMLLDAVINGELENDKDSLLLYLDKKLQLDTLS